MSRQNRERLKLAKRAPALALKIAALFVKMRDTFGPHIAREHLAINTYPLAHRVQMRRRIKPHAKTRCPQ